MSPLVSLAVLSWDLSLLAPAKMIFSSPPFETIETENVLHLAFNWPQKTNQSRGLMMIDTVLSRKSSWRSGKLLDWMCVSRIFPWMAYINVLMAMRESPGFENYQNDLSVVMRESQKITSFWRSKLHPKELSSLLETRWFSNKLLSEIP